MISHVTSRIVLTTDPDHLAKLRRKHEEYVERYTFRAPEVHPLSTYKLRLLGELLENGVIDVADRKALASKDAFYREASFDTAVVIIASYNANDLSRISGGTGIG